LCRLLLNDGESMSRKRWMKLIIRQQFDPAGEMLFQYIEREMEPCALI
jgi:hypothetical protein